MKFSGRFKSRPEANVGIGGCASTQPPTILLRKATFGVEEQPRDNPGYAGDEREQSRSCEPKLSIFQRYAGQ